jgi:ADP-heptose:LPS heptosyltransferase
MTADISDFSLPSSYLLLVPGGAPHRPQKRWPAEHYAALATHYANQGITPVLLGTQAESAVLSSITEREQRAMNLCGKTSIAQIAQAARGAAFAVGNDTGPMHVIAATGCRSTVLFSSDSKPERSAPIGKVTTLERAHLADLSIADVLASLTATA